MFCLRASGSGAILPVFHRVTLGREAAQCTFVLTSIAAGRKHCEFYLENDKLMLVDFGTSSLGTFVNKQSVNSEQPIRLQVGDVVSCGNESFNVSFSQNAKVVAARSKMARLAVECERIRAKSSDGLSDGQNKTLDRNEREIGSLEKQIYLWLQDGGNMSIAGEKDGDEEEGENVLDVVEDSLLDKTNNSQQQRQPAKAHTYDSLLQRIRELDLEIEKLEQELSGNNTSEKQDEGEEEEDELEKFMAMNAQELKGMDLEKTRGNLRQAVKERAQCKALAKLARPSTAPVAAAIKPREDFRVIQQSVDLPQEQQARKRQQVKEEEQVEEIFVAPEQTVDAWQPPTNQTGDGRSKANLKFGY